MPTTTIEQSIMLETLSELPLSSQIVVSVDVIDDVLPDSSALVESQAIYSKLSEISASLANAISLNAEKDVALFDYSEIPSVHIDGISDERHVISSFGDPTIVHTVAGYSTAGSQYFRIPSIVKLNNGRRLAIFDIRWQSPEDIGKTEYNDQCIGMVFSDDRGASWSNPKAIIDWLYPNYDPTETKIYQSGVSDPGIIYDEENDVVLVFALGGYGFMHRTSTLTDDLLDARRQQLVFAYSKDGGDTWSHPIAVTDKIFDADGEHQTWAQTYKYLYSTCTSGIRLRRQSAAEDNVLVFPVQLQSQDINAGSAWTSTFRIALLKVFPVYNENRDVVDIKLVLDGNSSGSNNLFGQQCGGANEGSICEGPNGEIVAAVRSYKWFDNPNGEFSTSSIPIRLFKAEKLGGDWIILGDLTDATGDRACSTLQTAAQTKPALCWSDAVQLYVIGYVQALKNNVRTNLILRCSSDLINWRYLSQLELKQGQGYITCVPQKDGSKFIECIYEAWNNGINTDTSFNGSSKQLKYFSLALSGDRQFRFSSRSIDQGAINSSNSAIQGFSFNLSKARCTGILSPTSLIAQPISRVRVMWGAFTRTQNDIYCVIYDSNSDIANPIAYSNVLDLQTHKDIFVEFELKQTIHIDSAHEYFIQFKRTSITPYPSSLSDIGERGALSTTSGNNVVVTTFCSINQTIDYIKTYQNGSIQYGNGHPLFVYLDLF